VQANAGISIREGFEFRLRNAHNCVI